jgi:hypothetical protein
MSRCSPPAPVIPSRRNAKPPAMLPTGTVSGMPSTCSTDRVLGFKGLERRAVMLVVNEESAFERFREHLYVGLPAPVTNSSCAAIPTSFARWADLTLPAV